MRARSVFLGAFAKLQKVEQIFMKFDIHVFFENLLEKIQVSLKSDNNIGYFTWRNEYICGNISLNSS